MEHRTVKEMADLVIACSYPNTPVVDGFKVAAEVIRTLQTIFEFNEEGVIERLMEIQCMHFAITDNSGFPDIHAGKTFHDLIRKLEEVLRQDYDGDWEMGINAIGNGWIGKNGGNWEVIIVKDAM